MLVDPIWRSPDGPREMGVPERVSAGPPGETVVPARGKPVGFAVKVWPATVKTLGAGVAGGRIILELPMNRAPDGFREIGIPEMTTAAPPGETRDPATSKP